MLEPRLIQRLDVLKNHTVVGSLERTSDGCLFRYTDDFLNSNQAQIARSLPKRDDGIRVGGTVNLPAYFAGLLPEGVMLDSVLRAVRIGRDDLFGLLAATGFDAVGDITTCIAGYDPPRGPKKVPEALQRLKEILGGGGIEGIRSISGVQPKISVGEAVASLRGEVAIVKLEPKAYPGILKNEWFFMNLASKAGLTAAKVRLEEGALVVTRFDRLKQKHGPAHQLRVEDSLQLMNKYPLAKYSLDYLEIMDVAAEMGMSKVVHLDLLRLYAYCAAIGNGDLHAKNVSFIFDERSQIWKLTPAYDLVCTLPYTDQLSGGNLMALGLEEQVGGFEAQDIVNAGARFNLPEKAIRSMLSKLTEAIITEFECDGVEPVTEAIRKDILSRAKLMRPA